MMSVKSLIAISIVTISGFFLAACNEENINTVDYYKNNNEVRVKKLEECRKNGIKNDAGYTANCQNAAKAERIAERNKPPTNFTFN